MKKRFTREERLTITKAHMAKHNGVYQPVSFVEAANDPEHPAHGWFTWDDSVAAYAHRLWQARVFPKVHLRRPPMKISDLTQKEVRIEMQEMPAVVSPIGSRNGEGGYIATDTPEGRAALLEEARLMLLQWLGRFRAILETDEIEVCQEIAHGLNGTRKKTRKVA